MAASTDARKVVIAVDRSPQAQKAFEWYLNSLHRPDNALVLIHVPEGAALKLAEGQWLNEGEIQKIRAEEKAESAEMKTTYNTILNRHNVKGEYRVVFSSKPGEAIVEAAKSEHAMLIVMGTRGMGTVRRTIMGSVSDYVVHHSDVPVVVYRHQWKPTGPWAFINTEYVLTMLTDVELGITMGYYQSLQWQIEEASRPQPPIMQERNTLKIFLKQS